MTGLFVSLSQTQTMLADFYRMRRAVAGYSPDAVSSAWGSFQRWTWAGEFGDTPAQTVRRYFDRLGEAVASQDMDSILTYWDLCERWLFCLSPDPVHPEQKEAA